MSASLAGAIAFTAINGLFLLLLSRIGRIRRAGLRSMCREGLFWLSMLLQLLAAAGGVAIVTNDGTWLGRTDDICCAIGGLWLGALALAERRSRRVASLPAGSQSC